MAKTLLRVRSEGVAFYLNSKTSSPNTGHRSRYRLFKTENYGRSKSGWTQVGSIAGQELMAIEDETGLLETCEKLFTSKMPHRYDHHGAIRGKPGKWEGEAFPNRMEAQGVRRGPCCSRRIARKTDWANAEAIKVCSADVCETFPKHPNPKSEVALVPANTLAPLRTC